MSSGQQFCVRWNSHLGSIGAAFPQLLAGQRFVDVTLACEGHQVHCHRLVLAACSTFFENLLGENPCKHPIIILPREIKLWAIQALVDFMYKGEVNVSQAGLPDLMKCAEILKIRGLCGSDAALNLNQITSPGGGSSSSSNTGTSSGQQRESSNQSGQRGTSPQRMEQGKGQQNSALSGTTTKTGGIFLENLNTNPVASSTPSKQVPSQQQLQQLNLHQSGDDGENSDNGGSDMCIKTEDLIIDEDVGKGGEEEEEMEMDVNDKLQAEDCDDEEDIEEYIENVHQELQQLGEEPHNSNSDSTNHEFAITITDENSTNSQKAASEAQPQAKPTTSSVSPPPSSLLSILTRGSIRVKSNENLFENYKQQHEHKEEKKSASNKHVYSQFGGGEGGGDADRDVDSGTTGLPSSLVYNRNTMDIYVKPKKGGTSTASNPDISLEDAGSDSSGEGYENIICSPNFPQSSMLSFQDDEYDDDFDIQILPDDSSMTNGESDTGGDEDLIYPPPLLPFGNSETSITRVPSGKSVRSYSGPGLSSARKQVRQSSGRGGKSGTRQPRESKPTVANGIAIAPSAFILRNPRGNQPRSYNTDALWKALMDVKAGESIYRASQIHKVPRKTLRNWMKRWDIKSAYPMPRQLKEAAEKKRIIKELTEQAQQLSDELTH